jgi:hypothetical protein
LQLEIVPMSFINPCKTLDQAMGTTIVDRGNARGGESSTR